MFLEAENPATGCPNTRDSVEIFISDVQADFPLDERYCLGEYLPMDANNSLGVDNCCHKGYTWILPGLPRPRTVSDTILSDYTVGGQGLEEFTLIVEDINGCTDTLTQEATVFLLDADFAVSDETICLPAALDFTDLSTADTTIARWQWSFGDSIPNPTFTFNGSDGFDTISVQLTVTDDLGCRDTSSLVLDIYDPTTLVGISPSSAICLGEELQFTAADYTEQGSFLDFSWNFDDGQTSEEQNPQVQYTAPGNYVVSLTYTEAASGCMGTLQEPIQVLGIPNPNFTTSIDDTGENCAGQIDFFSNTDNLPSTVYG